MKRKIYAGIDVGTHDTKVVLVEYGKNSEISVVGTGKATTYGMHAGYVTDVDQVKDSIAQAVFQASKAAEFKVKKAHIACGGISMLGETASGYSIISRADKEVTNLDIKNVVEQSEDNLNLQNKKIVYKAPIEYKVDGEEGYGNPVGMKGAKLDAKVMFVTLNKKHIDDLVSASVEAGLEVNSVYPGILAESKIVLSERQKMMGCAIINIGEDVTTLAVFENNTLISLKTYKIGGKDITGDIALYFKISLEEAESIKTGTVISDFSKKQVSEIIEARLGDIFESVEKHLKSIKRNGLLPAGVILTGGGAHVPNVEQVAKNYLNLPAQIGPGDKTILQKLKIRDDTWYVALGLALLRPSSGNSGKQDSYSSNSSSIKSDIGGFKNFFKSILSQLLP